MTKIEIESEEDGSVRPVFVAAPPPVPTPKIYKYLSLFTLVVQTTSIILLLRVTRTAAGEKYISSTAVTMTEVLKVIICLVVMLVQSGGDVVDVVRTLYNEIWMKPKETAKLIIPAALYTVQNNLLFLALYHLDAATYQVTYQLKILTTALFSVTMLSKRIQIHQWGALVLLTAGVALVQLPSGESKPNNKAPDASVVVGLVAVITACFSSGFSGVYFEKILKGSRTTLWIRNIQLGAPSVILGLLGVLFNDYEAVRDKGFFQGYNYLTVLVIFCHGVGGIIVALTIRYADNILKCFASAVSIILSCFVSYVFLNDFVPTIAFVFGAVMVIIATFLYGYEKPDPVPIHKA
ncbi:UDP-N-acetylglucosamine transporter-like [Paramacrobiotus metropolitanus]|uniref:UDP-N-acetylglucosamine transporter-like n=1 Tax=Paramacrobiotus metropolitanus TaxID=2943436 RepID=UPI00244582B9|nr:UDP-N-acetylglucosamine transporter-like [Paramacrobiotus metropolitanus]